MVVKPQHGLEVGVVRGELLLRADATKDAALLTALAPYGFTVTPVEELDGRVLRLSDPEPELSVDELTDVARFVRTLGHQASVNHITPLGPDRQGPGGSGEHERPPARRRARRRQSRRSGAGGRHRHRDLVGAALRRLAGRPGGDDNVDPLDDLPSPNGFLDFGAGHGTFTSGIVQQVHPGVDLRVYRAVDSDGVGSESDVACAMVRAVQEGAKVLNLSLGVNTVDDQPLLAVEVALDLIAERDPDVLVFAAAGNDGSSVPCWPAASKRVVSVAALAADLTPAPWSNHGFWVDCSAVGEGIVSTYVEGVGVEGAGPVAGHASAPDAWAVWSGTSFAAPQIAACRRPPRRGGRLSPRARRCTGCGRTAGRCPTTAGRSRCCPAPDARSGGAEGVPGAPVDVGARVGPVEAGPGAVQRLRQRGPASDLVVQRAHERDGVEVGDHQGARHEARRCRAPSWP